MIYVAGRILLVAADVVVVGLGEWASEPFSAYICWLNGGFKFERVNI